MIDFDSLPAPTDAELAEFDGMAEGVETVADLPSVFRLIVPRLTREIRRLRDLDKLTLELEGARAERERRSKAIAAASSEAREGAKLANYTEGLRALRLSLERSLREFDPGDKRSRH
jgi:hypothetical protein